MAGFLNTLQGTIHMQTQSSVFDDLARLMTGAMGMAQGMNDEAKSFMRAQADRFVAEMDLVGRDEFEAVKQLAADARAEADALKARVAALEAALKARD
jgi:BMFP domain-containing protein YqiC